MPGCSNSCAPGHVPSQVVELEGWWTAAEPFVTGARWAPELAGTGLGHVEPSKSESLVK